MPLREKLQNFARSQDPFDLATLCTSAISNTRILSTPISDASSVVLAIVETRLAARNEGSPGIRRIVPQPPVQ